ncbi:glutathione S-transferase N-terminal domain-containing protein [Candidimonas humi]|uniref:Glutathione S-transferase family protein n=1 Tax=Candidimonas humi TaxID=683355 RepID=A0ABV8NVE1_9BURK|nr:glutathione S-transferase N-terminal domain-containing protein [Candidimonas humi]MBV6303352.1 glutathione S-transferase N-terminal domain-containing protein [Candidimonas humi]
MNTPEIKLFYSPGACSLASHIVLEETGAPFEPVRVALAEGAQRRPEYLAINPKGRVPVIADGDFVLTENPAILYYLAQRFPAAKLWPGDPQAAARCAEWLAWGSSGIHVSYAHVSRPERYASSEAAIEDIKAKARASCRETWGMVEAKLAAAKSAWVAGEHYSVADAYMFVFWNWGRGSRLGYDMARDFPVWTEHARRMGARPAVKRALEQEGIELP